MKAFLSGVGVMIVLAVVAWFGLDQLGMSAGEVYSSPNGTVRLQ